ncbi:ATP-binding protein [Phenylobacterium sp. LjRoot225]|uniref:sensor histidine kinase n=1 Tax=Phenylobacterium sp. LjRoot225 TaxID=3342285 RepID=UPI003ED0AA75
MSDRPALFRRLPSPPIWLQIIALVVGGLVVAQVVTLALTLLLPPAPPQQHSLGEIAEALRGAPADSGDGRPLIRTVEQAAPSLESPGWVVSARTTRELASLLNAQESDVRILFYAPPPLAGTAGPPPRGPRPLALSSGRRVLVAGFVPLSDTAPSSDAEPFQLAQAPPPPPGGAPPPMRGDMAPGGPGAGAGWRPNGVNPPGGWPEAPQRKTTRPWRGTSGPAAGAGPSRAPGAPGTDRRLGSPPGPAGGTAAAPGPEGAFGDRPQGTRPIIRSPLDAAVFDTRVVTTLPVSPPAASAPVRTVAPLPPFEQRPPSAPTQIERAMPVAPPAVAPTPNLAAPVVAAALRPPADIRLEAPVASSVFGISRPSAYVEGEFVAALKTPAGWVTVRPRPEGFPNSWQRRVLLWFALSLALVVPPAYLLARRLVTPLQQFADTAERLGREPTADLPPLTGPAEIGRAASAFNTMRLRLRRYVEDRTGMISAITHDLRTPLARMRFKLERASPAVRASLARDVDQMEAMISSVLAFMRDELSGSVRETADLRSILECVVDDAGDAAELEPGASIPVQVDLLAIQRVFENLVDNAIKYGRRARVSLFSDGGDVVIEVADEGPGLPPEELAEVFKPFYRGSDARTSGAPGVGLGLAVSRSVLRSHGGDLVLVSAEQGLIARARLPGVAAVMRAA